MNNYGNGCDTQACSNVLPWRCLARQRNIVVCSLKIRNKLTFSQVLGFNIARVQEFFSAMCNDSICLVLQGSDKQRKNSAGYKARMSKGERKSRVRVFSSSYHSKETKVEQAECVRDHRNCLAKKNKG